MKHNYRVCVGDVWKSDMRRSWILVLEDHVYCVKAYYVRHPIPTQREASTRTEIVFKEDLVMEASSWELLARIEP